MIHVRTAYLDHDAIVRKGRYIDGSTALVLEDPTTGERLAKATRVHERVGCQACRGPRLHQGLRAERGDVLAALQDAIRLAAPART